MSFRRMLSTAAALACVALASAVHAPAAHAAPRSHTSEAPAPKSTTGAKAPGARQFTGYVTAVDKTTITVEKRGKQPRSVVFTKDATLETTGDVEKDARVTVYYREQDGHPTAHRVVVKAAGGGGKGDASAGR